MFNMEFFMLKKIIALFAILSFATNVAHAADITGAGATFPYPLYSKWAEDYKKETGTGLNYQSIGSGAGIKQIQAKTVTFGASDKPLKPEELAKDGLVQWPQVIGGIVVVYNLDGIESNKIVLDGNTLADIYLGKIKKWNDPAITKLNGGLSLPEQEIVVVRRSDGSGTTFNFTNYLSKVSPDWKDKVGEGSSVEFPVGVGAKGNDGVAANVAQVKGSIGYVEYAYAKQNKISYTKLINANGKTVSPEQKSFAAAAVNADLSAILTNQTGDDVWPITAATFIIMYENSVDKDAAKEAIKFFDWAFKNGNKSAESLDYISIPAIIVEKIKKEVWNKIK